MKNLGKKTLLTAALAALAITFSGCGKTPPTAQELVDGINSQFDVEYKSMTADVALDISAKADMGGSKMTLNMSVDMAMEMEEDIFHALGNITAEMMGIEQELVLETWQDEDYSYSYDYGTDTWSRGDAAGQGGTGIDWTKTITAESFKELTLLDTSKEEDTYIVTGRLDADKMAELGINPKELTGSMTEGVNWEDLAYDVAFTFDKDTQTLREIKYVLDTELSDKNGEVEITKLNMVISGISAGEKLDLRIPEKVKKVAQEESLAPEIDLSGTDLEVDTDWEPEEGEWLEFDLGEETDEEEPEKETADTAGGITGAAASELSSDWKNLQISMDGQVYSLPFAYDLLVAAGWDFDISDYGSEEYVLEGGKYITGGIYLENPAYLMDTFYEYPEIRVGMRNYSSKDADIKACDVWSLSISRVYGTKTVSKYPDVVIAGGITWGSSAEDIMAAYGQPEDTYQSDSGYTAYTYRDDNGAEMTLTVYVDGLGEIKLQQY